MCDTFVLFKNNAANESFFAKNSDRDPGEPQIIQKITDAKADFKTAFLLEKLSKYTKGPFQQLKKVFQEFNHPYGAIISRPIWMWGAEMGVNEKGVSIGNEAVFSKEKQSKEGLLGMDILRLALHNGGSAEEAANIIINLIEIYGQGGNGSYSGTLRYHNSFLIKDFDKAILVETSGKNWAKKEITDYASISNAYSLKNDYEESNLSNKEVNFKNRFEHKFFVFFSKGDLRQKHTCNAASKITHLNDVFTTLRSHIRNDDKITHGMKSVCVHPGILVKSETTNSMVVTYTHNQFVVWHTSTPNPCVSLYKPLIWELSDDDLPWLETPKLSLKYFKTNRLLSENYVKKHRYFSMHIKQQRNKLENSFIKSINEHLTDLQALKKAILACYEKETAYVDSQFLQYKTLKSETVQ
ncbi:hypothetical protein [Leptobacterium sp. I13]|uniref:hypothetical protein n=1 Tax=Leptobacterium meishanense TaxID=3128904 RepID=UPI0030EC475C